MTLIKTTLKYLIYTLTILTRKQTQSQADAIKHGDYGALFSGYGADGVGSNKYYYLNGKEMMDDGSFGGDYGVNFNNMFQSLIDGQPDQHEDYLGDSEIKDDVISLIDVRLTATTAAGGGSDYGGFIRIRNNGFNMDEFEIVIGDYAFAGHNINEYEAGVGGSFSEIDLFHNADIEFDYDSDYYLAITGRRDGDEIIRNPIDIIRHLAIVELGIDGDNDIDEVSYERAKLIHDGLKFDFSITEEIKSKKLFEEISKSTLCYPYFNNQGKLSFASYKPSYSLDDFKAAKSIKDFDVINFSFNKTKLEQVYTGVKFKYDYNYTTEKYDSSFHVTGVSGFGLFPTDEELDYNGYVDRDDNVLEFESPYIKDDETAEEIWKYKYKDHQYQHLTCKLKLPLHYIHLDVGDTIKFDKLLGDMKAFGIDYTRMITLIDGTALNGTAIYPMFFITSINKNLDSIDIEARQIHHIDNTPISEEISSEWGFGGEFSEDEFDLDDDFDDEGEPIIEPNEILELESPSWEDYFYVVEGLQSVLTTDVHHWLEPQAFGISNFNELVPSSWENYSGGQIRDYKAIELRLRIGRLDNYYFNETFVFALENVSESTNYDDFELAWTLNGEEYDETAIGEQARWDEWNDSTYCLIDLDYHGFFTYEERKHFLMLGEGLIDAINGGLVEIEGFNFYTDGIAIYNGYVHEYGTESTGDVNLDGTLNILDIVMIINHILNYGELNEEQEGIADVNIDSTVNILDIVQIVNMVLDA